MTERDKRVSDQLVRLVQIVFGLVLAQSLLLHKEIVVHPFSAGNRVAALALGVVYVTTVLSWIDWHVTMEMRPYSFSSRNAHLVTEQIRLGVDLFVVTVYAYLLFTVEDLKKPDASMASYFLGFPIIFAAYLLSGLARRRSHGKLATNPAPIVCFGLAYTVLYLAYQYAYKAARAEWRPWINFGGILLALGLMVSYRLARRSIVRRRHARKGAGLTVGIDVDGVLANQIDGLVPRVRARFGIELHYDDVTKWRLPLGASDIAQEIEIAFADPDYALNMPVHSGARELVDVLYVDNMVILITARPEPTRPWTQQWLQNHGFTYDELVNVKEQKKSLYRSDILIDDYIGNIKEYLTNTTGTAILVEQPWNREERKDLGDWIAGERLHVVSDLRNAASIARAIRASRPASVQAARSRASETVVETRRPTYLRSGE